jgi:hypothetical protein
MQRRQFIKTGLAVSGIALVGSSPVLARPKDYRPGGPWAPTERAVNYSAYLDNDELSKRLHKIDKRSDRVRLRQLGESAGRKDPIWEVKIGDGDQNIHIINQIHGDEPTGAEAMVKILERLATGNGPAVENILDELSITIMPRVNPDGANFVGDDGLGDKGEFRQRRPNTTTWEEGDSRYKNLNNYYYWLDAPGYDLNRGFNIDPDYHPFDEPEEWWMTYADWDGDGENDIPGGFGYLDVPVEAVLTNTDLELKDGDPYDVIWNSGQNLNPENLAVTQSFLEADPDWAITHHHQGAGIDPESPKKGGGPKWQSIMSVMAPFGPTYANKEGVDYASYVGQGNPFMSIDAQERSMQLSELVNQQMQKFGYGRFNTITRYGYGPLWGSYLDALPPHTDAAGTLYEVSHQSDDRGQKALGTMVKVSVEGFMATFERVANGSITDIDPMDYFDIPLVEYIEGPYGSRETPPPR